jgi:hypothetical protein
MKLASQVKIRALGFQNACQQALYAGTQLWGGTNPSPAKTLVPAVKANPTATPPVLAVAAVTSPAVVPDAKFIGSVSIVDHPTYISLSANLPYTPAAIAKGRIVDVAAIDQCSPAALDLGDWLGTPASATQGTDDLTGLVTVEQYFYRAAVEALTELTDAENPNAPASSIELGLYQPANPMLPKIPVVKVMLNLPKIDGAASYLGSVAAVGNVGSNP